MTQTTSEVFAWQPKYSVGIPEIDAQHKKLVALLNELFKAMRVGAGAQVMGKLFESLVEYTHQHFAFEENYMRKAGYAGLAEHIEEHRKLTQEVHELEVKYRAGRVTITMQVMTFLKEWLQAHILGSDAKYAIALRTANHSPIASLRRV